MKGPLLASVVLLLVVLGGTLGYVVIEGWGVWDAFYMTIITVTTVGYREVYPLSRAGQVFTVALLLGGVGAAFYTFTLIVSIVIERGLPVRFQWRRRAAMLERITDHFIVCGYGRIGTTVRRSWTPTCGSVSASLSSAYSAGKGRWSSTRSPSLPSVRATSWWCSDGPTRSGASRPRPWRPEGAGRSLVGYRVLRVARPSTR
jgi:hypothetical protein